jgi:hypothetical protein
MSCPLCQKRLRVKNLDSHLATSHRIQQHEVTDTSDVACGMEQPAVDLASNAGHSASKLASGAAQHASGPGQPNSNLVSGPGQPASNLVSSPGQPASKLVSGPRQPASNLVSKLAGQPASNLVSGPGQPASNLVSDAGQPASNLVSGPGQPASNLVSSSAQEDCDNSEIADVKSNMAKEPVHQESFHFIAVKDTLNNSRKMYVKESKRKDVINMNCSGVRDVASYSCKNIGKVSAKEKPVTTQHEYCDKITPESDRKEKINTRRQVCVPTVTTYRLK